MVSCKKLFFKTTLFLILFTCQLKAETKFFIFQEDTVKVAIQLFEDEDFSEALPLFKEILLKDPENKLMNYYYGACLAESGIFNDDTNHSLLKAVSGDTPDKVLYYVGLFFMENDMWASALKYFNLFKGVSTEEEKSALNIAQLINECNKKAKPLLQVPVDSVVLKPIATDTTNVEPSMVEHPKTEKKVEEPQKKPVLPKKTLIDFQVNSFIGYTQLEHFKNNEALGLFKEGQQVSKKLDSILYQSDSLRVVYESSSSVAARNSIAESIINNEQVSFQLKMEQDQLFTKARSLEIGYWSTASQHEVDSFMVEVEKSRQKDISEKNTDKELAILDTFSEIDPTIFFNERVAQTEEENGQKEDELIYRIQIGAYSRGLPAYVDKLYKKLSLIRKIDNYTDEKGVVVYTTGRLTDFDDAIRLQKQVRQEGIKDAFVVPYLNGKRITIREAKEIIQKK